MASVHSAGILLYRDGVVGREVWIAHMGGPYWARKEDHAWSIPKGEYLDDEDPFDAARREFVEETGIPAPSLAYRHLGVYRYSSGKLLTVFAAEAPDFDPANIASNTFDLEWPPRSGRMQSFPELDRAAWVTREEARRILVSAQAAMLDDLM
ncbi:MAG: NUDIX domain-containing protein [Pseudolysinimonas sp.]|uniref:NUDIX domain-containing protein n=1 Tax=Pseudolysinimonas sp. TaxID=2680009 RepID=UPI0032651E25